MHSITDLLNTQLFRDWFYGTVMVFYAVVLIWIMFFFKDDSK
jgi:hypothetical protein